MFATCPTVENVSIVESLLLIFAFMEKPMLALVSQPRCFSFPLVLQLPEYLMVPPDWCDFAAQLVQAGPDLY